MTPYAAALGLLALMTSGSPAAACPDPLDNGVDVYPTAEKLPENLLRFSIYFSRSMAASGGLRDVQLLDPEATFVDGVFLATNQKLFSPDRTRLTLLLDPKRVKSGLAAREAMGRALIRGQSYSQRISGSAEDTDGCALGSDFMHPFTVTDADFEVPDPDKWSLSAQDIGSRDPMWVVLGSPMIISPSPFDHGSWIKMAE